MKSKLYDDDDDDSPPNKDTVTLEINEDYGRKLIHNRERDDLRRYEEEKKRGEIVDDDDDESESEEVSEPDDDIGEFIDSLVKVKTRDPLFRASGFSDGVNKEDGKKKKEKEKKKKMYLKDVQARQLLEEGPDSIEENEERGIQTYAEQSEELRRAVCDAMETGGSESDDDADDLLRVKEGDDSEEEDEELKKKADEYFGEEAELDEGKKFLRDYLLKQLWKEKDGKSKMDMIDEQELDQLDEDEEAVEMQEDYENKYRHEENAGETVMGQSRIVEGSVRKKDNSRKAQRKNKEGRMKIAEMERQEELKRLKNVKKKEMKEKMKKVLSVAGFKEGEECPLDAKDLDDEFDSEEYDKMMKAAFDDNYYGAEDEGLCSDEDDDNEKPDFDKEDELLGLPKDWDVIQSGDGFIAAREKVLKHKENADGEEEEEEVDEEEEREVKRKRKRKTSLVQRAKEALMEEYYKLDYEDTIGDLKTRFKFAKVQPNSYGLEPEEILFLDDTELNQYVPLKKMAPYMEKDWEVNRYKVKEQKLKVSELWQRIDDNHDEKKRSKKRKKKEVEEKKKKPAEKADEEGEAVAEAETSKLSRKAKRRRLLAEKKLPPNRMVAYGKAN